MDKTIYYKTPNKLREGKENKKRVKPITQNSSIIEFDSDVSKKI